MSQIVVGTRQLKNRLSEYLRRVKAGETVIITERGKPVGQILPFQTNPLSRIQAWQDAGLVEWNGQSLPDYQPKSTNRSNQLLSDLIEEMRE